MGEQFGDAVGFAVEDRSERREGGAEFAGIESGGQGVVFFVAIVLGRIGFVEKNAAGGEGGGQRGELIAKQTPDDDDEVEGLAGGGPGEG